MIAAVAITLAGCSKDDDGEVSQGDYSTSIVGTWKCVSGVYDDGRAFSALDLSVVLVFDQYGTVKMIDTDHSDYFSGTYSISGNTLILYVQNKALVFEIILMEKNKMVIYYNQGTGTFTKT
ncbi:MAG: lipocalin family protein [Prevotellaceae bacterium]|nr:lipocalin family protein [Prevotellaceae bacterium]